MRTDQVELPIFVERQSYNAKNVNALRIRPILTS